MLLCARHGLPFTAIAETYRAALDFACPGEDGSLFPADAKFRKKYALEVSPGTGGACEYGITEAARAALPAILTEVSGLDRKDPVDSIVYEGVLEKMWRT
jgi:hypothetical protein